jgi:hypothetical protein
MSNCAEKVFKIKMRMSEKISKPISLDSHSDGCINGKSDIKVTRRATALLHKQTVYKSDN